MDDIWWCIGAGLRNYESQRQYADARAVSRLSAYLHWGMVSTRHFHAEARARGGRDLSKTFSRRLIWRDLAYWQLHHWPDMACLPIRRHYAAQVSALLPGVRCIHVLYFEILW